MLPPASSDQTSPRLTRRQREPLITLKLTEWRRLCLRRDLVTDGQRAEFMGLARQTINQIQRGRGVGDQFIALALTRFAPLARFEDLFDINRDAL